MTEVRPSGSWKSPITTDLLVSDSVNLENVIIKDGKIYWKERRAQEKGRSVVVKYQNGKEQDLIPAGYNDRTLVHEYGSANFLIDDEGALYFTNYQDQVIYKAQNGEITPVTKKNKSRYADLVLDKKRNYIYCIEEEHTDNKVINRLSKIDLNGQISKVHEGRDFYSSVIINNDYSKLAFLCWDNPSMPWDAAELWLADIIEDGSLTNFKKIAGSKNEDIFQPRFGSDGFLYFVSDKTNWWNLYRYKEGKIEAICPMNAEFGYPSWAFGFSMYDFVSIDNKIKIVAAYNQDGAAHLLLIDPNTKEKEEIKTPYSSKIMQISSENGKVVFIGSSPSETPSIVELDIKSKKYEVLKKSKKTVIDEGYISIPKFIKYPTTNNENSYAFYYAPKNKDFSMPAKQKPPLIVISHGGPTAHTTSSLSLEVQYWTSRGFAIVDVNYGGSTGFGRKYREKLYKNWGVVDVDDCTNAALYLVKEGLADKDRLIIKGGSAGGYTTLCALTFKDVFKAGASYFGLSDLEIFERQTHKFEAKYDQNLVGKYPEEIELFRQRSPINYLDRISCPVIFLQGDEDKIVPPNQSELMFEALKKKKIPTAYLLFEKEQHGFRDAKNIKRAIESELYFYSKVFGFELADKVEPIKIENSENL